MRTLDTDPGATRGQSEVLGVALLIGIAVIGAVAVATVGFAALDSDREEAGFEQAERSLSQFDSRASEVALGRAPGTRVDFGLPSDEGTMSVRPDEGWMRVNWTDLTGQADPNTQTVTNTTLGSVVYRKGDRTVGYQAGGVFRSEGGRSTLASRPEFHYRNGTLTIPIIKTEGNRVGLQEAQVTPGATTREFPDPAQDSNLVNKVDNTTVVITVKSRYYEAWGDFFREYTNGVVEVDHAKRTASVQFITLPDPDGVGAGIVATAESGALALEGTGAYVDSYDSSVAPYPDSKSSNGTVRAVGDVNMTGDSMIDGNADVGETVEMSGDAFISGDVGWTEDEFIPEPHEDYVGGNVSEIDGVATVLPIDPLVIDRVNGVRNANNNSNYSFVSSDGTEITSTRTIGPGRYYTDHLLVDGQQDGKLIIDTDGENVTIGVEDYVTLPKGGQIEVEGGGTVKIYLNAYEEIEENPTGEGREEVNFYVGKNSEVLVPDNRSPQFRIFAQQELQGYIGGSSGNNATFNGLVYAPDGLEQSGEFYTKQAQVYGGLVAGEIRLGQYGRVHYDKDLADLNLPTGATIARLEYLHVAVHRMNVTRAG